MRGKIGDRHLEIFRLHSLKTSQRRISSKMGYFWYSVLMIGRQLILMMKHQIIFSNWFTLDTSEHLVSSIHSLRLLGRHAKISGSTIVDAILGRFVHDSYDTEIHSDKTSTSQYAKSSALTLMIYKIIGFLSRLRSGSPVRTGGSKLSGLAALIYRNIQGLGFSLKACLLSICS